MMQRREFGFELSPTEPSHSLKPTTPPIPESNPQYREPLKSLSPVFSHAYRGSMGRSEGGCRPFQARHADSASEDPSDADNSADAVARGRNARGATSYAKLTEPQAIEIKRRALAGETQAALAREFRVHQCEVSRIKSGKRWGHLK